MAKKDLQRKNRQIAFLAFSVVFLMVALTYASVPLYRLFCQVTGFGGTTQVSESAPTLILDREVRISFNADIHKKLPWEFKPDQRGMTLKVGQTGLAFYTAINTSDTPVVGTATYNVTPLKAGKYFHKIQCFCFEEQVLHPGQSMQMPVQFYIDPKIADDPNLEDVNDITLSYTFFKAGSQELIKALNYESIATN